MHATRTAAFSVKLMSRQESVCGKCKAVAPCRDDSWCLLCRALQSVETLARRKGVTPAFRALAEETILQAGRQVEGIFNLDKQSRSYIDSLNQRLTTAAQRAKVVSAEAARETLSAKAGATKPPLPRAKSAGEEKKEAFRPSSEEETATEEEDPEQKEEASSAKPPEEPSPSRGPKEPAGPPPQRREEQREDRRGRSRSRNRGRRGGRKHQQTFRALEDPKRKFHKKLQWQPIPLERERERGRR